MAKQDVESSGAKARDHEHRRHHFLKTAHRDWRVWVVVMVMIGLILVYVMSDNLSIRPGQRPVAPTPSAVP